MQDILRAMLGDTGYVVADEQRRCLNVGTTRANMRRVESIVRELDIPVDDHVIKTEVEELRARMRQLGEQMQQIQNRLAQIAEQSRAGNANGSPDAAEPYKPEY
jgi:ribosomal protein L12E/L44/L45/RPP1/RPP2